MKKRLILHVGIHKTGTTAIQSFLSINHELLRKKGYYVPVNHFTYENKATAFREAIWNNKPDDYEPVIRDIIENSDYYNCDTIVLSDEDFHHFALQSNKNINVLEKYFDIEIVMYIRRQDKFAESVYGFSVQWFSTRFTEEFSSWVKKFPLKNYKWDIDQWEDIFKYPILKLRVYDEVILFQDVILDFIHTIGLNIDDNWFFPTPDKSNVTLNKYIIEFLRRTNHIKMTKGEFESLKEFLVNESSIRSGPKAVYLSFDERTEMLKRAEETNRYIAKKYFNRNFLFPKVEKTPVPEELTDKMFKIVLNELKESPKYRETIGNKILSQIGSA